MRKLRLIYAARCRIVEHPVKAGFLIFYVMLYNENKRFSAKALKTTISMIQDLTEASAEVSAIFHTYQVMVEETGMPVDPQIMEECAQIFQTVSRMLLREQADLKHQLQMQSSMKRSDECIKGFRQSMAARKAANVQEGSLFTQAAS